MQRTVSLAVLSLAARSRAHCVRKKSTGAGARAALSGWRTAGEGLNRLTSWGLLSAGHSHRLYSSLPEKDLSFISVVGSPDPITWVRCRVIMFLIKLYFEVDLASEEFESGAKQALVQVSHLMSTDRFHRLKGLVSDEMMEYVETRTRALSKAHRQRLAVTTDDIIFLLPEDISVVFDKYGRKFCSIAMRFWFLTTLEGPEDPEATKIFKVSLSEDGGPQKKVATAVYEFNRELTQGASHDWTVTTVWHWHWTLAKAPD